MQAFPFYKEFEFIGKLRSSSKSYFENSKENHKKSKPFLKLFVFLVKTRVVGPAFLYLTKEMALLLTKKESYITKMKDLLSDDSKYKHYIDSNHIDKNPFILCEEKLNWNLLLIRNAA